MKSWPLASVDYMALGDWDTTRPGYRHPLRIKAKDKAVTAYPRSRSETPRLPGILALMNRDV
jgi:hypothetical protein